MQETHRVSSSKINIISVHNDGINQLSRRARIVHGKQCCLGARPRPRRMCINNIAATRIIIKYK